MKRPNLIQQKKGVLKTAERSIPCGIKAGNLCASPIFKINIYAFIFANLLL